MLDLDELERLAKAATPGPWFVTCNCTGKTFYTIKNSSVYIGEALGVYNGEANASYIVAACNALPSLIAENRALQERVRELEKQRDWLADALQNMCAWNQDNESCYVQHVCPAGKLCVCAGVITKYDWIEAAEQAAKEAGE